MAVDCSESFHSMVIKIIAYQVLAYLLNMGTVWVLMYEM